ncbi:MAG: hypothetical protein SGILL_002044, partial [Bacillariaceae sp.]
DGATECVDVFQSAIDNAANVPNVIQLGGGSGPKFTFDHVFDAATLQSSVYEKRVEPLVVNCLEGYNATVLAYGQTGSGKTHTIMGPSSSITTAMLNEEERQQGGVIPRAIRSIFQQLQGQKRATTATNDNNDNLQEDPSNNSSAAAFEYEVRIQFLEVYGEEIRDLLNPQQGPPGAPKLSIRDVGNEEPEVVGATEHKVESAEEALLCLTRGMYRRVTGSTAMNETSSRSHAILSLIIEQSSVLLVEEGSPQAENHHVDDDEADPSEDAMQSSSQQQHVQLKKSKFNFVDLAGSERQKRTQSSGQRLKEGIDINKGLLVLGNVISALGDPKKQGKTFVPYRDSKLTRLLKGSLGGNHKTLMIACVSPSSTNVEETLNCLRYANRAKNIQNHAVVNVDAKSALVAELKGKVQRLAEDLMKARTGKISECSIPLTVIESLVKDAEGTDADVGLMDNPRPAVSPSPRHTTPNRSSDFGFSPLKRREPLFNPSTPSLLETKKLKAENEAFRIQVKALSDGEDTSDALQKAYVTKATEYERQIAALKRQLDTRIDPDRNGRISARGFRTPRPPSEGRSESPELSRLKSQVFGSLSKFSNVDAEVDAEERSVKDMSEKYLFHDDGFMDNEDMQDRPASQENHEPVPQEDSSLLLEADLVALSSSINAKEELIFQLQTSQEKFETMREFYEERLREMETVLYEKEAETDKLSEELKKLDVGHKKGKELSELLKQKQAQVQELRRKQAELSRLTSVASRNESQISRLRNEVNDMKSKKVDLQKQITSERKEHMVEVQHLKRETMKKDRELNKVKRDHSKKSQEAVRAQQVAKTRLDQIGQLKAKYKDTEKKLRMQTIKRGVMAKAGLNPVLVGRRQSTLKGGTHTPAPKVKPDIDGLRDLFDQKVADVSRREHLAVKVAQEWEEHYDLTSQRDTLRTEGGNKESIQAIESQIKYREDRIRSIASRLGKREKDSEDNKPGTDDSFLFGKEFEDVVGDVTTTDTAAKTAANVLFGMVVRERRRIASLARTASQLDEKVQEAQAVAESKDAAFRAYVDEQRLQSVSLAQNQQEHILSLMEMVKETPGEEGEAILTESSNSKLLVLANERIAVLERQLNEVSLSRDAVQKHREREESARSLLDDKNKECEELEEEIDELRSTLRRIREQLGRQEEAGETLKSDMTSVKIVQDIVARTLHPSTASAGSASRRRRSSTTLLAGQSPSMTHKIKRDSAYMNTSDSEEMPDWADEIMADLAIIAEGKIPEALRGSKEILEIENQLNGNDVFDRLTNPNTFTGAQKHRSGPKKPRSKSIPEKSKQGELTAKQVADSLYKIRRKEASNRKSKEKRASGSEAEQRSVFVRLLSPSSMTGTHKQKFHDTKGRTLERAIESQHVSTRGRRGSSECENDSEGSDTQVLNDLLGDDSLHDSPTADSQGEETSERHADDSSKGRQDGTVYDRLSKTMTSAFAVKQNPNVHETVLDHCLASDSSQEEKQEENPKFEIKREEIKQYQKKDVFERLTEKKTEAYVHRHLGEENMVHHRPLISSPSAEKNIHHSPPAVPKRVTRSQANQAS